MKWCLWNIDGDGAITAGFIVENDGAAKAGQEIAHDVDIGDIWDVGDGGLANGQQRGCHQL